MSLSSNNINIIFLGIIHRPVCISKQYSEITPSRNRTHVYIKFLLRMTDTMTFQNIDLSSWDVLHFYSVFHRGNAIGNII
jgi:hypothetical protein